MKQLHDEVNRLTSCNNELKLGVYSTPNGFLIKNNRAQIFIPLEQAKSMVDDLEDMVIILRSELKED